MLHDISNVIEQPRVETNEDILPATILEIIGEETITVLPTELSIGAYNDINMVVMPSVQSYNAYTANLDRKTLYSFPEMLLLDMCSLALVLLTKDFPC